VRITYDDEVQQSGDRWLIAATMTDDSGLMPTIRRHLLVIPTDTMEWRAAEYDIDPTDTATLLDIVLAEMSMTEADWSDGGTFLATAPDIETARVDHVARCARVKLRHRVSTRRGGSPLAAVVQRSPLNAEAIAVKRELVKRLRAKHADEAAARSATPPAVKDDPAHEQARVDRLRRLLGPPETEPQWRRAEPRKGGKTDGDVHHQAGTA
jgi:hypothetical protein